MSVLLLRLSGPMQSWGTQSRFTHRDTNREPSKSGVVGLVCAACGIKGDDNESIAEIASMPMGVRVEREGTVLFDYHTAGGSSKSQGKRYGVHRASGSLGEAVISYRYYLADADFLVALDGDRATLENLANYLSDPVWPLYLGRKAFVPGFPVHLEDGLIEGDIEDALLSYPWLRRSDKGMEKVEHLRLVLESDADAGRPSLDVPISFDPREYKLRYIKTKWLNTSEIP